jgi:hypothetical protein
MTDDDSCPSLALDFDGNWGGADSSGGVCEAGLTMLGNVATAS